MVAGVQSAESKRKRALEAVQLVQHLRSFATVDGYHQLPDLFTKDVHLQEAAVSPCETFMHSCLYAGAWPQNRTADPAADCAPGLTGCEAASRCLLHLAAQLGTATTGFSDVQVPCRP